jgi:hypothetical protein
MKKPRAPASKVPDNAFEPKRHEPTPGTGTIQHSVPIPRGLSFRFVGPPPAVAPRLTAPCGGNRLDVPPGAELQIRYRWHNGAFSDWQALPGDAIEFRLAAKPAKPLVSRER